MGNIFCSTKSEGEASQSLTNNPSTSSANELTRWRVGLGAGCYWVSNQRSMVEINCLRFDLLQKCTLADVKLYLIFNSRIHLHPRGTSRTRRTISNPIQPFCSILFLLVTDCVHALKHSNLPFYNVPPDNCLRSWFKTKHAGYREVHISRIPCQKWLAFGRDITWRQSWLHGPQECPNQSVVQGCLYR